MAEKRLHKTHLQIAGRLERAEGHLRIIAMVEEGRSGLDLAQQLHAVDKAIGGGPDALLR